MLIVVTWVGKKHWEPEVSDVSSVPDLLEESVQDVGSETTQHEVEVQELIGRRSGMLNETLFRRKRRKMVRREKGNHIGKSKSRMQT